MSDKRYWYLVVINSNDIHQRLLNMKSKNIHKYIIQDHYMFSYCWSLDKKIIEKESLNGNLTIIQNGASRFVRRPGDNSNNDVNGIVFCDYYHDEEGMYYNLFDYRYLKCFRSYVHLNQVREDMLLVRTEMERLRGLNIKG